MRPDFKRVSSSLTVEQRSFLLDRRLYPLLHAPRSSLADIVLTAYMAGVSDTLASRTVDRALTALDGGTT